MSLAIRPVHHVGEDLLLAYAAGSVTGERALICAVHLSFCPECRNLVAAAEKVAGAILEESPDPSESPMPVPTELGCTEFSPLNGVNGADGGMPTLPEPLRSAAGALELGKAWRNVWFGVRERPIGGFGPSARLMWIPAGRRMPRHDHGGEELTLVLQGSFSDGTGVYCVGDIQTGLPGLDHQPKAGPEGPCICLVVESGGLKLSGLLGRLAEWGGTSGQAKS